MPMVIPERHDERVALLPIEAALADLGRALAAKYVIDHRTCVAMGLGFIARRQKLKRALDRRHRRPARERIAILQQVAVEAISRRRRACQRTQRLLGVAPFVMEEIGKWNAVTFGCAKLIHYVFAALLDRLTALRIALLHDLLQRRAERNIQTVEPQHRLLRIIGMIVPGELGRENQIAGLHHALLAVDGRVITVAFSYDT